MSDQTSVCRGCQKSFTYPVTRKRDTDRKYCSMDCYAADMRINGRPGIKQGCTAKCNHCAVYFPVMPHDAASRKFCSYACRGAWQSSLPYEEWRGKLSSNKANRPRGEQNGMWGKTAPHGKVINFIRRDGRPIKLKSRWEHAVAAFLDGQEIPFEYEPKRFRLLDRTYVPDFFLPDSGVYWEVKGWMHERHAETIRQFREMQSSTPLIVIGSGSIRGFSTSSGVNIGKAA